MSVVLLAASPPGDRGVGQNYIRDVLGGADSEKICVYALLRSDDEWCESDRANAARYEIVRRRYEHGFRGPFRAVQGLAAFAAWKFKTSPFARDVAEAVGRWSLSFQSAPTVVVVLESPVLALAAAALAECCDHNAICVLWDHPRQIASAFGHPPVTAGLIEAAVEKSIRSSRGCLTVSDALQGYILSVNPDVPVQIARVPVCIQSESAASVASHHDTEFRIGFAGSVTSPAELEGLQQALDHVGWRLGNREVVVRLLGSRYVLSSSHPRRVEYRGFMPTTAEAERALAECDVTFLPQPFEPAKRSLAEYSFPTKLSTYLAAGRPVLIHAPKYSSLANFAPAENDQPAGPNSVGAISTVPDARSLIPVLEQWATNDSAYDAARDRARSTARSDFDRERTLAQVRSLLFDSHPA